MRMFLQQPPQGSEPPRFVKLSLEQDLLGGWLLNRETGTAGGRSQLKREVYLERDRALAAFEAARDQQIKRGFRIMFAEGTEHPR